jgi:hypothetical protein
MKNIDLAGLLDRVKNFGNVIGPSEYQTLIEASLLLSSQFPSNEQDKIAYLTKSSKIQSELINLQSRVSYIVHMKTIERNAYWGSLVANAEFDGYGRGDRDSVALSNDSKYRDLSEVVSSLDVIKSMIENQLWSIKILAQKL